MLRLSVRVPPSRISFFRPHTRCGRSSPRNLPVRCWPFSSWGGNKHLYLQIFSIMAGWRRKAERMPNALHLKNKIRILFLFYFLILHLHINVYICFFLSLSQRLSSLNSFLFIAFHLACIYVKKSRLIDLTLRNDLPPCCVCIPFRSNSFPHSRRTFFLFFFSCNNFFLKHQLLFASHRHLPSNSIS